MVDTAEWDATLIDPITAEVIRSAMETICFEMATFVSHTATTPILNQSNERNATILDAKGRLAALSVGIPQFMLSATLPVRFCLEFLDGELYPGDVIVANDPYHGGGHLPDFNVFSPVFSPDGELLLVASIQCHHGDTGGALAGGYNVFAKDIWSEGTRYPLLKIIDGGKERRDVDPHDARQQPHPRLHRRPPRPGGCRAARRPPSRRDHRAVRSDRGEVRGRVHHRRRPPPVLRGDRELAERHLRSRRVRRLRPDGQPGPPRARGRDRRRRAADRRLRRLRRAPGDLGRGRPSATPGAYVIAQLASMVDPTIPKNEGFFDCIDLRIPLGSCLNPVEGKPVSSGTHHPGVEVGDAIAVALSQIIPDRCVAADLQVRQPPPDVGRRGSAHRQAVLRPRR